MRRDNFDRLPSFRTLAQAEAGVILRDAGAARRPRRAWRQGVEREARAQRLVSVWLGTPVSKSAACAPAASTATSATITSAISESEVRGRTTESCQGSGELAERQGIAVLTRRDRKVGQVRLLHSPPLCSLTIELSFNGRTPDSDSGDHGSNPWKPTNGTREKRHARSVPAVVETLARLEANFLEETPNGGKERNSLQWRNGNAALMSRLVTAAIRCATSVGDTPA